METCFLNRSVSAYRVGLHETPYEHLCECVSCESDHCFRKSFIPWFHDDNKNAERWLQDDNKIMARMKEDEHKMTVRWLQEESKMNIRWQYDDCKTKVR